MDITNTPSRVELAVPPARTDIRANTGEVTGQAETRNPVTAPDKADTTRATRHHDPASQEWAQTARSVQPLDVFQVGDNDDIPPPPEPPRHPLAMLAMAPPDAAAGLEGTPPMDAADLPIDTASDVASGEPQGKAPDPKHGEDIVAKPAAEPAGPTAAAMDFYQSGAPKPVNRTVDIRS